MSEEAILKLVVEVPRSTLLKLKERFQGDLVHVVAQAIESAAGPDDEAVRISKDTMLKVCSLVDVAAINSERSLVEAIQARLNVQPGSVLLNLDPNVTQAMEQVARSNGITLAEAVKNFFQFAIANGWFETTWDLYSLLFTQAQWKRLKNSLGILPSDASTVVKILNDWAEMQAGAKASMAERDPAQPTHPEQVTGQVPGF